MRLTELTQQVVPPRLTPGYAEPTTINPFFPDATSTVAISSANGWAVHSTASDVATVVHAVFTDDGFLSPALRTQLLADPSSGGGMRSGLGVIQFDRWSDLGVWGHAGYGIRSHSALALHQLDSGVTVVVLTNLNTDLDDYATNEAIVRAVLEDAAGAR